MKKVLSLLFVAMFFVTSMSMPANAQTDLTTGTENFINSALMNGNGTLATYLVDQKSIDPDFAAGRETLSESLGLMMMYLAQKGDRVTFAKYYEELKQHYLSKDTSIVYWKLSNDGSTHAMMNAIIDDWRIADALFMAGEAWNNKTYIQTALNISNALNKYNQKQKHFVDFYDEQYKVNNDTISLFYIDPVALNYMVKYGVIDSTMYNRMVAVLRKSAGDGPFFPQNYNVRTKEYQYNDQVNLIEQIYTAYFRKQAGINSPAFYSFLKKEFNTNGVIYGQYDRVTGQPAVDFESNAVYGMTILYALKMNDVAFAKKVYKRMKEYEITDVKNPYYGGYVVLTPTGYDTHIFDNLFPLLAKQQLEKLY
ncbi:glycosyl hydrolase family 8 [Priestia koreensis]|uniref:glycosyl hydrolase family 8 n=1 Tax=Priestia koreensis TaxID=284581 RepID=UPI001F55F838|nr:glycosyl hydrolase family 8 [Priestia koreensis]UNL85732.1 hypothetical protein IE339_04250 [Priestia koreensis]